MRDAVLMIAFGIFVALLCAIAIDRGFAKKSLAGQGVVVSKQYTPEERYMTVQVAPGFDGNITMVPVEQVNPPVWFVTVNYRDEKLCIKVSHERWDRLHEGESYDVYEVKGRLGLWAYQID